MKLVRAIIRPEKLTEVLTELFKAKITGLTVTRVRGHGGETEIVETYRGATVKKELTEKIMLDIGVSDPVLDTAINILLTTARTGKVGDGKILVLPVEKIYRIRTGEEDVAAVTPVAAEALA